MDYQMPYLASAMKLKMKEESAASNRSDENGVHPYSPRAHCSAKFRRMVVSWFVRWGWLAKRKIKGTV
jgi:hypothetical protein